jgi:uncharacterized protein (TIGR03437 family)
MHLGRALSLFFVVLSASAQSVPTLTVDANASRHPISPLIYGIDDYSDNGLANLVRTGVRRWGGDATSRYNWQLDTINSASDWYYTNNAYSNNPALLPNGSEFDLFVENGLNTGTVRLGTVPVLGWLPKSRDFGCSYSVAKYGSQQKVDPVPGDSDCGNGLLPDGTTPVPNNDPNDVSTPVDQTFAQAWIQYLVKTYGTAQGGGVQIWDIDNEPEWWDGVHMDVHPSPSTYDEDWSKLQTYGAMIKQTDPTALVSGPVAGGWSGMFYSSQDMHDGWSTAPYQFYDNPEDQQAHGGLPLVEWYLQQAQQYEQQNAVRLLDYLDVHAYIAPAGITLTNNAGDPTTDTLRLTSTRVFWDPNYVPPPGLNNTYPITPTQQYPNGEAPELVPRMIGWVNSNYPGTKTAITEYNWGATNDITGAIAEADILGIFGQQGLDMGCMWGPPNPNPGNGAPPDPATFSFEVFLNYDGQGNQFGETGISATTTDPDTLSIFAAQRSDNALTVLVLNKSTSDISAPVSVANFQSSGTAQVWSYSSANLSAIVQQPSIAANSAGVTTTFPARSMTLLVLPEAAGALPVPQPVIAAVTNSASYAATAVSPGEIVTIFGSNMGPSTIAGAQLSSDGAYLTQNISATRVLVNGYIAPMLYTRADQVAAVVPYEAALSTTAYVQVEYQGVRSAPFNIPVAAAVPGLFTDGNGTGQGAILNQNLSVNSSTNPAHAGDTVVLYATGEGQTVPPGVDGRLALSLYPVPAGACSVTVAGAPANVAYCGAAPNFTAGVIQINAQIPQGSPPGNLPVVVTIGGGSSASSVTVAVQ